MSVVSDRITIYREADVVRSATPPSDTSRVWVDTSMTPPTIKTFDIDKGEWTVPNEAELTGLRETIESHETKLNIIDGEIETLISDTYIVNEDGTTVSTKELYSQIEQKVDSISTTVSNVETSLEEESERINSVSSTATQTAEKFSWIVRSGTSESDFEITDRMASLTAEYINMNGMVSFGGLNSDVNNAIEGALQTASASKVLALSLSSEFCPVQTDSDGNNGKFDNVETIASCYFGSEDVSSSVVYTYTSENVEVEVAERSYTIIGMTGDTGYIDITASYNFTDYNGTVSTLTDTKRFTISKNKQGAAGPQGEPGEKGETGGSGDAAVSYSIEVSVDTITKNISNQLTPASIEFGFYKTTGNTTANESYSGRCIIAESPDGTSWETTYASGSDESSHSYTPVSTDISYIRCTLYASGGTSSALGIKTVNVVFDADTFRALLAEENGETVIDGGKIMTNSIIGKSIEAGTITADKLETNTITADTLNIESVSRVFATQEEINNLEVGGRNLIYNTETPTTIMADTSDSAYFAVIFSELKQGKTYTFSANVTVENTDDQHVTIQLYDTENGVSGAAYNMVADGTRQNITFTVDSDTPDLLLYAGVMGATAGVTAIYEQIKLERGRIPSDYTPAPEDTETKISQTITEQHTSITNSCEEIVSSALESYVSQDEYGAYKEEVESKLSQTSDSIKAEFNTQIEEVTDVNGDLQSKITELYKYIRFSQSGITIGDNSGLTLTLDNDMIYFSRNGTVFGRWDGNDFYTGNVIVRVDERAQFGNFTFSPRPDGSLMFTSCSNTEDTDLYVGTAVVGETTTDGITVISEDMLNGIEQNTETASVNIESVKSEMGI